MTNDDFNKAYGKELDIYFSTLEAIEQLDEFASPKLKRFHTNKLKQCSLRMKRIEYLYLKTLATFEPELHKKKSRYFIQLKSNQNGRQ